MILIKLALIRTCQRLLTPLLSRDLLVLCHRDFGLLQVLG